MTIRTEITAEWRAVLAGLPEQERWLLVDEADHLAHAITYQNRDARLSTNGALEVLFAIGCWQNRWMKAEG